MLQLHKYRSGYLLAKLELFLQAATLIQCFDWRPAKGDKAASISSKPTRTHGGYVDERGLIGHSLALSDPSGLRVSQEGPAPKGLAHFG